MQPEGELIGPQASRWVHRRVGGSTGESVGPQARPARRYGMVIGTLSCLFPSSCLARTLVSLSSTRS
jgi:hypothetical protein